MNPISWLLNKKRKHQQQKEKRTGQDEHIEKLVDVLSEVVLLSGLSPQILKNLALKFHSRFYGVGEDIFKIGSEGDEFYIITKGSADVILPGEDGKEQKIVTLEEHEYFGEQALLNNATRMATVRACTKLEVLVLNRQQFQELNETNEILFAQRRAVIADDMNVLSATPEENTNLADMEKEFIKTSIKTNMMFANHNDDVIDVVINHFRAVSFPQGETIIAEGQENATTFYVIADGEVEVITEKAGFICNLKTGHSFGELALMYNAPRNATIKVSSEKCSVFVMERQAFRYAVIKQQKADDERHYEFLRGVKLLSPLLGKEIALLDMAISQVIMEPHQKVFAQNDDPDKFYIVKKGFCHGTRKKENDDEETFVLTPGNFFGELALLNNEPRSATIIVGEEGATLLELGAEDFRQLLGPLQQILERNAKEYEKPEAERVLIGDSAKICELHELKTIGLLGRGAFGKVTLVVDPSTKKSYALKAIKKTQIEELGQASHIVNEKKVMMMMSNRFLVNLRRTYKDQWRVYFLVDVCLGGELFTILRKKRSFNEKSTRFYAGCVVEAFSYMHGKDIIYRDLKPENLVMDTTGYIKVTDFGFAKVVPKKTYTLCGTPDYLAPEIVTGQGHGKGVDWWCLGVLVYELLSSFPPFFDDEPMGTYRKIIQGKFKFPKYFSTEARDLIARLLRTKPTKRLAVMKGGADNIRNHVWYKGFDWLSLREGQMGSPYKPEVKSNDDIGNFDQRGKKNSIEQTGKAPKTPWDVEF